MIEGRLFLSVVTVWVEELDEDILLGSGFSIGRSFATSPARFQYVRVPAYRSRSHRTGYPGRCWDAVQSTPLLPNTCSGDPANTATQERQTERSTSPLPPFPVVSQVDRPGQAACQYTSGCLSTYWASYKEQRIVHTYIAHIRANCESHACLFSDNVYQLCAIQPVVVIMTWPSSHNQRFVFYEVMVSGHHCDKDSNHLSCGCRYRENQIKSE